MLVSPRFILNVSYVSSPFSREYASLLQTRLPAPQATAGQQHRLADDGEVTVCYVVNTAEYCADILPQLEDMIKWVGLLSTWYCFMLTKYAIRSVSFQLGSSCAYCS